MKLSDNRLATITALMTTATTRGHCGQMYLKTHLKEFIQPTLSSILGP